MTDQLRRDLAQDLDRAFPELVDRYGTLVVTIASRLTDPTTGEDITQEVFLRAYRAMASYGPDRVAGIDLRPWLATITRNLIRNEYRRRGRKPSVALDTDTHAETATSGDDPTAPAEARVDLDHLDQTLQELSDAQREAVVLRHIVGLPMREVALTMGVPHGTAKSHVSRGLARLRTVFDAQEVHP